MENSIQNQTGLTIVPDEENFKVQTVIGNNASALAEILMSNITKVQESEKYIPQAQEIANQVRELVNLAKVEVDMYRVANGISRRGR